jgi:hypothetical protein
MDCDQANRQRTLPVPIYPFFNRKLHIQNFFTMLLKYARIPSCCETALAAPSYCENLRSVLTACPSIYRFNHIILQPRRDCNLSVPTIQPLSLAINKAAASLLLLLFIILFTSYSSVKCLESLFPHVVPAWQHSRE